MTNLKVAETILSQLGGQHRLTAMIGAHDFVGDHDSLMFAFRGSRKANKCRVTLLSSDTYRVELFRVHEMPRVEDFDAVYTCDGVYVDQLIETVEHATGLRLMLRYKWEPYVS